MDMSDLAQDVIECYERDRRSRADWEEKHKKWVSLYYQTDVPIATGRWAGASNESVPILTEACNQFHTRMYSTLFANPRLVQPRPTGRKTQQDEERAERVGLHMTWQLTQKDRTYRRNKDKLLLQLPRSGCVFTKTFRDNARKMNMVQNVRAIDLVVPYGIGPRAIEDIENKTECIWTTLDRCKLLAKSGYLSEPPEPGRIPYDQLSAPELTEQEAQGQHFAPDTPEEERPVLLLESHRLVDLNGDGFREPYIVTVDPVGRKVLRIALRYEVDELGNPLGAADWYDDYKPVELYTTWNFLENPDGFYGLGMGHILGELNKAVNRLLRETIDAGSLANILNLSGFTSSNVNGPQGGPLEIELGKFKRLNVAADDLNKVFKTFQVPGPNASLIQALELLLGRSDRLGLNTEAVTGQLERTLQPTTVLALLDESNKSFGSVNERVVEAWTDELQKIYRLNRMHMDPVEEFQVLDITGSMADQMVTRGDYELDLQILPTVDPQMQGDREKLQRAQITYQTLINEPLVNMDPTGQARYQVIMQLLKALRVENIDQMLPNPMTNAMAPMMMQRLMMSMMNSGKDEAGLHDGGAVAGGGAPAGPSGVAGPPGGPMGVPGTPPSASGGQMQSGANMGGVSPGSGSGGNR